MGQRAVIVDPAKRERKSLSNYNYHTLIMDNAPDWRLYPKRSKSLNCCTNKYWINTFGSHHYIVFPFDHATLGICPEDDLHKCFEQKSLTQISREIERLLSFSDSLDNNFGVDNYKELCDKLNNLSDKLNNLRNKKEKFYKYFKENVTNFQKKVINNGIKEVEKLISPQKNGFKVGNIKNIDFSTHHEIWTDSKCLLIEMDYYFDTAIYNNINDYLENNK